ncbi:unnamed protein product [Rhizophagus irregularis]|uniref:Uncharacterized protein n=1 Tax=Rhizophagus irregularis TaxID=588596 RepID=A0A915YZ89_9GLOM|nr:unnamed protein product [Rhizophagus irregularis]CAB5190433.1 unnamed protein product [Rhizophagus irregularis]CAB5353567.1 unnamed protein product [Rhizophagus irregularis]
MKCKNGSTFFTGKVFCHGKFGFDTKPSIRLNIMVVGRDQQQKTIRNVDGKSVLDFYVEENLDSVNPGLKQFR